DDEPGIVDFVKKIYSRKGFATFGVTDGTSAVDVFQRERPHISLIDIHMPYSAIDGVETLKKIKEIDSNAVCIMVTRVSDKDKIERARQLSAFAYLLKPMNLEELDTAIDLAKNASGW
ncbi:response regulator, partial [bacterium]